MEIYRGPLMTDKNWKLIQSKKLADCAKGLVRGSPIEFEVTKDETAKTHSWLRLKLDEEDVLALFNALVERYRDLQKLEEEAGGLRQALTKIDNLISYHSGQAPSKDAMIKAVQRIAQHFSCSFTTGQGKPELDWIEWNSI